MNTMYEIGDRVELIHSKLRASVVDIMPLVSLELDNGERVAVTEGQLRHVPPSFVRKFAVGDVVEIAESDNFDGGRVGVVIKDDGDEEFALPYTVQFCDDGSDDIFNADELKYWKPVAPEYVWSHDDIGGMRGLVIAVNDETATVIWDTITHPQAGWRFNDLRPWFRNEPALKEGDKVICVHPFFSRGVTAVVIGAITPGVTWVKWDQDCPLYANQIDGAYPTDNFKRVDAPAAVKLAA